MVYKEIQKNLFSTLQRKMVRSETQQETEQEPASIKNRLVQSGRSYALITRTENRQPIIS